MTFSKPVSLLLLYSSILILASGCQKAPMLKAVKAIPARVESTISTTTTGTVDAEQQAVLAFNTVGRVEKILVKAGQSVKKGQILATLENRDYQSTLDAASKEFNRAKALFKSGLTSRANLDEAEKTYEIARANLEKTTIRAPFDGIVTEENLEVGELSQTTVASTNVPIRLVDQKPRIIKGDVDEVDLSKVHVGTPARVKISAVRNEPYVAVLDRVVEYVNTTKEQERTAKIELKLTNESEPIPVGASAEIELITESKDNTLAVPSRSVLGTGDQRYVYRFIDGRLAKTQIMRGIGNYDRTEVLKGLSAGDVVILPGDEELKDRMKAKVDIQPWP